MPAPIQQPSRSPLEGFEALKAALSAWEPALDLDVLRGCPRLYEPDGTLHAVCLSEAATFVTDRREVEVRRGDLIVLPRSVGVDVLPSIDAITVRHDGPQPFHFRERFIQVWTFEHLAAPARSPDQPRHTLLETSGLLHRLGYAILDAVGGETISIEAREACHILVGLGGELRIEIQGEPSRILALGEVALAPPWLSYRVDGTGRYGELSMISEFAHEGRALERRRETGRVSPEFGVRAAEGTEPAAEDIRGTPRA
ncbi:hypothetical protein EP7_001352 [Isosphaeraceae bacterium EP7]